MQIWKITAAASALAILSGTTAIAGCGITAGNVSILANDFPAIQAVAAGAAACAGDGVTVTSNLTKEHESLQMAALSANPAQYTVKVVATSSIVPLLREGLIRPLDDLVAAHGQGLNPTQLIKVGGQTMAIAFMSNAQHLFYRTDILDQVGLAPPATYEEVLAAAEAIRAAGIMEYPFALNTGAGWNLAEEFVNMHLGMGGTFFNPGTAEPAINNETGVATLNMLKELVAYSNPDFLTFDSNATQALWESGNLALATMWGSRAGAILDGEGSTPEVVAATGLAAAPTVGGGATPATTLWWDGFTIAKNVSDADAEASFIAMMNGMTPEVIAANNDAAVWLAPGYTPGPAAAGVIASAIGGATPYPMEPFMGLMHTALGDNLSEFLQGSESAEQALADAEAAYIAAAREQGFLN
jgi:ABC-type glycerol-3-phosphate transport system substrate-binding protein